MESENSKSFFGLKVPALSLFDFLLIKDKSVKAN